MGVSFADIKADTIGIVTSVKGEGGGLDLTWELWSDNSWYTFAAPDSWGSEMNVDLGIFPIVDLSSGLVENGNFINGIKMQTYPNPASEFITLTYEVENAADVSVEIYTVNGQRVRVVEAGQMTAGIHTMDINVSDLSAGTYVYSLVAGSQRLTKRMIIE